MCTKADARRPLRIYGFTPQIIPNVDSISIAHSRGAAPCPAGKSLLLREFLSSPPSKNKSLRDLVDADLLIPHPASMKRGVTADRHETWVRDAMDARAPGAIFARICASVQRAQSCRQKIISSELGSAWPPKALALPLAYRISARPVGSSPIEITPFPARLKEPETSVHLALSGRRARSEPCPLSEARRTSRTSGSRNPQACSRQP